MQNNFLTTIRSLKLLEAGSYKAPPATCTPDGKPPPSQHKPPSVRAFSLRAPSLFYPAASAATAAPAERPCLLPFGLPTPDSLPDPPLDRCLRPVDPVAALAASFRRISAASPRELCDAYVEQHALYRALGDAKQLRRALRAARVHAAGPHLRVVLSAWLRHERREDEFDPAPPLLAPCTGSTPLLECPRAAVFAGSSAVDTVCPCRRPPPDLGTPPSTRFRRSTPFADDDREAHDLWFLVGEEEVPCDRWCIAALSKPLNTLLYGGFAEARRDRIDFSHNGVSPRGMRAVAGYSRRGQINDFPPDTVLELLAFSTRFCCDGLKAACDGKLASLVRSMDDALSLIEVGLDEAAHLLVAACLQVILRELPRSLSNPEVVQILCSPEGRDRLAVAGSASFVLYYFLASASMEANTKSNTTVMLLERLGEFAERPWQKQLAPHLLGCVMLERGEHKDAQEWFTKAAEEGHVYSLAGVARAKFRRGHKYLAYKLMNGVVAEQLPTAGWMYQERSQYCDGEEKMDDLRTATELDPTLTYPYMYRAVALLEEEKAQAGVAEINRVIGFRMEPDCLALRAWLHLAMEDREAAAQDVRVMMTLDPDHMLFNGKMHGEQVVDLLKGQVEQWDMADCWMQLYDRWSAVDDIGSLCIFHKMIDMDPKNSNLRFRQSLLLLRLNCQKAAMRSLRMARNYSNYEHERLVYEGWILYDTGHREEALVKAEESIKLQRSFEALFLKAYGLGDAFLDLPSALSVVALLEQANTCASDNLRKGQAYNNMGSIYADCHMLDEAAKCYEKAISIKHTRAHQGLARVYYLKDQKTSAYDEMTKLIEKAKDCSSAYEKRSEYGEREAAMADLDMASRLDPTRSYPYRFRAAVLMDENKDEEAIWELSRAIAFRPDLQLLHLRAAFFDSTGERENAVRDCEAALCLDPTHADALELYTRSKDAADLNIDLTSAQFD